MIVLMVDSMLRLPAIVVAVVIAEQVLIKAHCMNQTNVFEGR